MSLARTGWLAALITSTIAISAEAVGETRRGIAIEAVSPAGVRAGGTNFILRIRGSGFTEATLARWNGSDRVTAVHGPSLLSAMILSSDLEQPGSGSVTVYDPATGSSKPFLLAIDSTPTRMAQPRSANPEPRISGVSPAYASAGSGPLKVVVRGAGFTPLSVVRWRGASRPTRFVDPGTLGATIEAEDLSAAGTAALTVRNPLPGGGVSRAAWFAVHATEHSSPGNPRIHPNPWREGVHDARRISFENLARRSIIKIFTVSGAVVRTIPASSGAGQWDLTNDSGRPVSAGAYIYRITDGQRTLEGKLRVSR